MQTTDLPFASILTNLRTQVTFRFLVLFCFVLFFFLFLGFSQKMTCSFKNPFPRYHWKLVASRMLRKIRGDCPAEESIHFSCILLGSTGAADFHFPEKNNKFSFAFQSITAQRYLTKKPQTLNANSLTFQIKQNKESKQKNFCFPSVISVIQKFSLHLH